MANDVRYSVYSNFGHKILQDLARSCDDESLAFDQIMSHFDSGARLAECHATAMRYGDDIGVWGFFTLYRVAEFDRIVASLRWYRDGSVDAKDDLEIDCGYSGATLTLDTAKLQMAWRIFVGYLTVA